MAGLTSTGLEIKSLVDTQTEMVDGIHAAISPTLNLTETSLLGQDVGVTASQLRQLWEALAALYASWDVDQAEGAALNDRTRLMGTSRRAATYSTASVRCTLTAGGGSPAGTYAAGTLTAHVTGDPTLVFANTTSITVGGTTTAYYPFESINAGEVRATAGTLAVIASPVAGFTLTSPYTTADAVVGLPVETDAELRARRRTELARRGSTTVDAIRTDLTDLGVVSALVIENDTDTTDAYSIAPHGIGCYVIPGAIASADIAEAIFAAKAGGITTSGSTSVSVTDTQGSTHTIRYTVPAQVPVYHYIHLTALDGVYAGNATVRQALIDFADENFGIGRDVIRSKLMACVADVEGVLDVTGYTLDIVGPPAAVVATSNIVMSPTQYAGAPDLTTTYVVIITTTVAGPP